MPDMITRAQAIALYGSVKELQAALGLKTHSAISMWGADRPIPREHYLRLRYELKPEAFTAAGKYVGPRAKPTTKRKAAA